MSLKETLSSAVGLAAVGVSAGLGVAKDYAESVGRGVGGVAVLIGGTALDKLPNNTRIAKIQRTIGDALSGSIRPDQVFGAGKNFVAPDDSKM